MRVRLCALICTGKPHLRSNYKLVCDQLRLSHIKLAGFKSFVDPTHIPVPGDLVGRGWSERLRQIQRHRCRALGARGILRQASARRNHAGRDLQWLGRAQARPIAPASNWYSTTRWARRAALGRNTAEIAVKRVLERDGESTYYINNMHVRRRDVADIFLGTGLGGRAYAIIEQGMISRIVEARPEELRTFLEEAAGISKYRERRKETEQRLEDTRENLARVDDILQELTKQLAHLEEQAEVATQYRSLEGDLKTPSTSCGCCASRMRKRAASACSANWSRRQSSWKPRPRACASWRAAWRRYAWSTTPRATPCTRRKAHCTKPTLRPRDSSKCSSISARAGAGCKIR